jgi:DNA-binding NarL/FixJ family response regulator
MDVSMPGASGADVTKELKELFPTLRVLALSVHEELAFARMLLDAGAAGYALKRTACDELVRAVRLVAAGEPYVDPLLAEQVLRSGRRRLSPGAGTPAAVALSEREAEVARLLAQGLTMKEIAERLSLSPRTLETYRARAMDKLGLTTRADLVRYAIRRGWLSMQ